MKKILFLFLSFSIFVNGFFPLEVSAKKAKLDEKRLAALLPILEQESFQNGEENKSLQDEEEIFRDIYLEEASLFIKFLRNEHGLSIEDTEELSILEEMFSDESISQEYQNYQKQRAKLSPIKLAREKEILNGKTFRQFGRDIMADENEEWIKKALPVFSRLGVLDEDVRFWASSYLRKEVSDHLSDCQEVSDFTQIKAALLLPNDYNTQVTRCARVLEAAQALLGLASSSEDAKVFAQFLTIAADGPLASSAVMISTPALMGLGEWGNLRSILASWAEKGISVNWLFGGDFRILDPTSYLRFVTSQNSYFITEREKGFLYRQENSEFSNARSALSDLGISWAKIAKGQSGDAKKELDSLLGTLIAKKGSKNISLKTFVVGVLSTGYIYKNKEYTLSLIKDLWLMDKADTLDPVTATYFENLLALGHFRLSGKDRLKDAKGNPLLDENGVAPLGVSIPAGTIAQYPYAKKSEMHKNLALNLTDSLLVAGDFIAGDFIFSIATKIAKNAVKSVRVLPDLSLSRIRIKNFIKSKESLLTSYNYHRIESFKKQMDSLFKGKKFLGINHTNDTLLALNNLYKTLKEGKSLKEVLKNRKVDQVLFKNRRRIVLDGFSEKKIMQEFIGLLKVVENDPTVLKFGEDKKITMREIISYPSSNNVYFPSISRVGNQLVWDVEIKNIKALLAKLNKLSNPNWDVEIKNIRALLEQETYRELKFTSIEELENFELKFTGKTTGRDIIKELENEVINKIPIVKALHSNKGKNLKITGRFTNHEIVDIDGLLAEGKDVQKAIRKAHVHIEVYDETLSVVTNYVFPLQITEEAAKKVSRLYKKYKPQKNQNWWDMFLGDSHNMLAKRASWRFPITRREAVITGGSLAVPTISTGVASFFIDEPILVEKHENGTNSIILYREEVNRSSQTGKERNSSVDSLPAPMASSPEMYEKVN